MNDTKKIPIIVGVTGHRAIREEDIPAIKNAVKSELRKLSELCPNSEIVMLNSLAEGGDLLCADTAEELGLPLIAVLPRPLSDYKNDFSREAQARLSHHCARADRVFTAPATEALPVGGPDRNFEFRQAGIYMAAHSHVLLALWDGGPGTAAACGTAETVDFALNGSFLPVSGISPRSERNEKVIHIFTPRGDRTSEPAGTVHILGNEPLVRDLLRKTDDFNKNAAAVSAGTASRLPTGAGDDACLTRIELVGRTAGKLSLRNAVLYRRILALLAAAGSLLTFAFLMYDEASMLWMILPCGAMIAAAWGFQLYAARSDCHRRYIEYRVLAETLRVQTYLRYAGSRIEASNLLSWTQQEETSWVLAALCALSIGEAPKEVHDIRACWVDDQRDYHRNAAKKSGPKLAASGRIVNTALYLSVGLYLATLVFELVFGGLILPPFIILPDVDLWRMLLKIILGTISAVTLFVGSYYGRLSLPRILSDHQKMARFYSKMSLLLQKRGQTDELLTVLAREELIENGGWCSYQRDNTPDMSI